MKPMKPITLDPMPELSDVPENERTATVKLLLSICHRQQVRLVKQAEQATMQAEQIMGIKGQ